MGYLFIRYTDGLYDVNKKVRIDESEEKEIIKVLKSFELKPELMELESYDTTTFSIAGYTFYLNEDFKFNLIMKKVDDLLLKDAERKKKHAKSAKQS